MKPACMLEGLNATQMTVQHYLACFDYLAQSGGWFGIKVPRPAQICGKLLLAWGIRCCIYGHTARLQC